MKDIEFKTNENFKGGVYEITIRDVTRAIENKMADVKIELTIIDPEEIAAAQAQAAQAKGGAPKKK